MIFKEDFKIGLKDIGKENTIKNRGILECLENIAAYHSDYVKNGANETKETNIAWVLLDWKLEVIKRPKYGQKMHINTWARWLNKFFTYRDYEVFDEEGNLCAIATSKWTLMDIKERKMVRLTEELMNKYSPEEKFVFSKPELDKLKIPDKFSANKKYEVIRKDMDTNNHMHNLYYLDLAYEALPEEIYEQRPFNNVRIMYKKEITLGDIVDCNYTLGEDGKHIVVINSQEGKVLHAIIELSH